MKQNGKIKGRKHDLYSVLRTLDQKKDVRVTTAIAGSEGPVVQILVGKKASNDLGNKSWGKIDYLVNHLKFKRVTVTEFQ